MTLRHSPATAWSRTLVAAILTTACMLATGNASAQESKHYYRALGCPWANPKQLPAGITLDELECKCFGGSSCPKSSSSSSSSPSSTAVAGATIPKDTRLFRDYEGRDIDGQDIRQISNVPLRTCVSACKGEPNCKGISFDKWNNYCFLKNNVTHYFRIEPQAIVLVRADYSPVLDDRPIVVENFPGKEFRTKPFRTPAASTYEDCKAECRDEAKCEVFSFEKADKVCRLIAHPDEYVSNAEVDSGVKRQRPIK